MQCIPSAETTPFFVKKNIFLDLNGSKLAPKTPKSWFLCEFLLKQCIKFYLSSYLFKLTKNFGKYMPKQSDIFCENESEAPKNFNVKKKYRSQFAKFQKSLLYILLRMNFSTTCIEGFFDFSQIEGGIFFYEPYTKLRDFQKYGKNL